MTRSYEAVYERGTLRWIGKPPAINEGDRVIVLVEDKVAPRHPEIEKILSQAWGAWGSGKSMDDIDREIARMREDWERVRDTSP